MSAITSFIQTYLPFAKSSEKYNVPALFALAQSALETGYGRSVKENMMFGLKTGSNWKGKRQLLKTTEYHKTSNIKYPITILIEKQESGKYKGLYKYTVKDWFRAYDSPAQSFEDWAKFLRSSQRYAPAFNFSNDSKAFAYQIAKAGYATDPNYYNSLAYIIDTIKKKTPELELSALHG